MPAAARAIAAAHRNEAPLDLTLAIVARIARSHDVDEVVKVKSMATAEIGLNEGLAEYVSWRYQGGDGPPLGVAQRLRGAAQAGQLPSLGQMASGALISQANPHVAYATSAMAVRELMNEGGPGRLLALIRKVGQGAVFEEALREGYGRTVPELDASVKAALSRR